MHTRIHVFAWIAFALAVGAGTAQAQQVYVQTNLVSNGTVPGTVTDPNLVGAWGMSFSKTSPVWVSDQAANIPNAGSTNTGASTLYSVTDTATPTATKVSLTVGVSNLGGALPDPNQDNGPTGQVSTNAPGISFTSGTDFLLPGTTKSAGFVFSNLDGSISAFGGSPTTIVASVTGASFTGLAIGNLPSGAPQLYAADQNSGNIDVFNNKFQMVGSFTDPNYASTLKPLGINAFNVQELTVNGVQTIFATYANQATGAAVIDEFSTGGTYLKTLVSDLGAVNLNAPWGMAIAPAGWGKFGGDLLVANNNPNGLGLTEILAYNLTTGAFEGVLTLSNGQPFSATELWAISFGNGGGAGSTNTLLFAAGLDGNTGGLLGAITLQSVPEPNSAVLALIAVGAVTGGWQWKNRRRVATS